MKLYAPIATLSRISFVIESVDVFNVTGEEDGNGFFLIRYDFNSHPPQRFFADTLVEAKQKAEKFYGISSGQWDVVPQWIAEIRRQNAEYRFLIEHCNFYAISGEVNSEGYYLYAFENGRGILDNLQDTLECAKEVAFEDFGVPLDGWRQGR